MILVTTLRPSASRLEPALPQSCSHSMQAVTTPMFAFRVRRGQSRISSRVRVLRVLRSTTTTIIAQCGGRLTRTLEVGREAGTTTCASQQVVMSHPLPVSVSMPTHEDNENNPERHKHQDSYDCRTPGGLGQKVRCRASIRDDSEAHLGRARDVHARGRVWDRSRCLLWATLGLTWWWGFLLSSLCLFSLGGDPERNTNCLRFALDILSVPSGVFRNIAGGIPSFVFKWEIERIRLSYSRSMGIFHGLASTFDGITHLRIKAVAEISTRESQVDYCHLHGGLGLGFRVV